MYTLENIQHIALYIEGFLYVNYCRYGNFRLIFISPILYFRIFLEVLYSQASIRVVSHFRGLNIGIIPISSERQILVFRRSQTVAHTETWSILHADFKWQGDVIVSLSKH